MSERVLMVSPYPPVRDGIASYAVQEVLRLTHSGAEVEVLSPGPSAAHHHLDLRGWRGPLALAKRVRHYDRTVIQFHPDVFYPHPVSARLRDAVTLGLMAVCRAGRVEVRVHEVNYEWGREPGLSGRLFRALWRQPARLTVHTETERAMLAEAMDVPLERIEAIDHGAHFERRTTLDRAAARQALGIDAADTMFLSIGFIQEHKGFDRAVAAFAGLGEHGCRLDIVGSTRLDDPDYVAYLERLRLMVSATPGAHLHDGYVSDERFDEWLVAADVIVLPYRFIWSSGVIERAKLYDRRVIVSRVGGLEGQVDEGAVLVDDDAELRDALVAAALRAGGSRGSRPVAAVDPWPAAAAIDHGALQAAIARRAEAARRAQPATTVATGTAPPRATALAELGPLQLPPSRAANPATTALKKLVKRLTAWQIEPIVGYVNALRTAELADSEAEVGGHAGGR